MRNKFEKPKGLALGPSQLDAPEGALSRADNVAFTRTGQLEARRGYRYFFSENTVTGAHDVVAFGTEGDIYGHTDQSKLFRQRLDGSVAYALSDTLYPRPPGWAHAPFVEMRGQLLVGTDRGVYEVQPDRFDPSPLGDEALPAGLAAPTFTRTRNASGGTLVPAGSRVGYRALFGRRLSNGQLLLGAPGSRTLFRGPAGGRNPTVEVTLGEDVRPGDIIQLYRTSISPSNTDPGDECFLVFEREIVSADFTGGVVTYEDLVVDQLLGAALYTNQGQDTLGILDANNPPPLCRAMTTYRGHGVYANTQTNHILEQITMVGIDSLETFSRNLTTTAGSTTATSSDGDRHIAGQYLTHPGLPEGTRITNVAGNTLTLNKAATSSVTTTPAFSGSAFVIRITCPSLSLTDYDICYFLDPTIFVSGAAIADKIRLLTEHLVNQINTRTQTPTAPQTKLPVYAEILSTSDTAPGSFALIGTRPDASFEVFIAGSAQRPTPWLSWAPMAIEGELFSDNNRAPNRVAFSKPNQEQAVRRLDYLDVGSDDFGVVAVRQVGQTLFIVKRKGLYALQGPDFGRFTLLPVDENLICLASRSVVELQGHLYYLTQKGVVKVAPGGNPEVVSGPIDDELRRLQGAATDSTEARAYALAYETEGQYILHLPAQPGAATNGQAFCLTLIPPANPLAKAHPHWTRWTTAHRGGCIIEYLGQERIVALAESANVLVEARSQTTRDYGDVKGLATFSAQTATGLISDLTITGHGLSVGDGVLGVNTGTPIQGIVTEVLGVNQVRVLRTTATTYGSSSVTLIAAPDYRVEFLPMHGGLPTNSKRWIDASFVFERNDFDVLAATYRGNQSADTTRSNQIYRGVAGQQAVRTLVPGACRRAVTLSPGFHLKAPFSRCRFLGADMRFEVSGARSR